MTTILHIDSSVEDSTISYSRRLSAAAVARLLENEPASKVVRRDLVAEPVPHISHELRRGWTATADARSPDQVEIVTRSEGYIAELKAADVIVIGSGMYNFSVASSLKAWVDHVLITGQTFRYTPEGEPVGLMTGKRAVLALARGGVYSNGPLAAIEHQESLLRVVLGFIGVTDVEVVRAEGIAFGPDAAAAGLDKAMG